MLSRRLHNFSLDFLVSVKKTSMLSRKFPVWLILTVQVAAVIGVDVLPVRTNPQTGNFPVILTSDDLVKAFACSKRIFEKRLKIEGNLTTSETLSPYVKSAETRHYRFQAFNNNTSAIDQSGELFIGASKCLKKSLGLTRNQVLFGLQFVNLSIVRDPEIVEDIKSCQTLVQTASCDATSKYRTPDGSCNNLKNPTGGKTLTSFSRLLAPDYGDVVTSPRKGASSTPLPKARTISRIIHEKVNPALGNWTTMAMQFGQFLSHDLTKALMDRVVNINLTMLECCPVGSNPHPECFPISIPNVTDDFFTQQKQNCLNFVRSATCPKGCQLGPRQQSNSVTAYIDASNVYGNSQKETTGLREMTGGLLKSQINTYGEFPPNSYAPTTDQCSLEDNGNLTCFQTGDGRSNQQPGITALQILFFRAHNTAARAIQEANPNATDEEVFQRARRLNIAIVQNIAYSEYLPIVLGPLYMDYFKVATGESSTYNPDLENSLLAEFGTTAQRFGHPLIPQAFDKNANSNASTDLGESFFEPFVFKQGPLDPFLGALAHQQDKGFDPYVVPAVTHDVYKRPGQPFGLDLVSIDIQRGRDHGIPGYVKYLRYYFGEKLKKFADLGKFMEKENWSKLKKVYKSNLGNVDLFSGGVSECALEGAIVGPTLGFIVGIQFNRLKYGDRFYFEHQGQTGSFTSEQLAVIRKSTMSQVLCENTDRSQVQNVSKNAFLGTYSSVIKCDDIPKLQYSLF